MYGRSRGWVSVVPQALEVIFSVTQKLTGFRHLASVAVFSSARG